MPPRGSTPNWRLHAAILFIIGATLVAWSWGTWPDAVLDYGREVYVPWRLSEGDVLYRDIVSYFNGPLSPYLHATLFKMFGASFRVLVWFNILNIALLTSLLYSLIRRTASGTIATLAAAAFLVLFAFAQNIFAGNYNYVAPYSYELSHGLMLSAATILLILTWHHNKRSIVLALAGMLLGLVFLTKAEVFLGAAAATITALAASMWVSRANGRSCLQNAGVFLSSMLGPVILAFLLLLIHLSAGEALRGLAGSWKWVGDRTLLQLPFFKTMAGTDDLPRTLSTIAIWLGGYCVVFGMPILLGMVVKAPTKSLRKFVFITWLAAGIVFSGWINWANFIRPMPLLIAGWCTLQILRIFKRQSDEIVPLVLGAWALAMLAKISLDAHIYHYGFALAMPATLVGFVLLASWIPAELERYALTRGSAGLLRCVTIIALVLAMVAHLRISNGYFSEKTATISAGGDAFAADEQRAAVINEAVASVQQISSADQTLAVLPEGLIVNYLSRRVNPTGQLNFTPPALIMYGEDEMVRAFQRHPPDLILISGVETPDYGARVFGTDYGRQLSEWIRGEYEFMRVIGAAPFQSGEFGMALFRRKAPTTALSR